MTQWTTDPRVASILEAIKAEPPVRKANTPIDPIWDGLFDLKRPAFLYEETEALHQLSLVYADWFDRCNDTKQARDFLNTQPTVIEVVDAALGFQS